MKKSFTEKRLVITLFVMVLVVFSFAEKDSKQLIRLYTHDNPSAKAPMPSHVRNQTAAVHDFH